MDDQRAWNHRGMKKAAMYGAGHSAQRATVACTLSAPPPPGGMGYGSGMAMAAPMAAARSRVKSSKKGALRASAPKSSGGGILGRLFGGGGGGGSSAAACAMPDEDDDMECAEECEEDEGGAGFDLFGANQNEAPVMQQQMANPYSNKRKSKLVMESKSLMS